MTDEAIGKTVISEEELQNKCRDLGEQISKDFTDKHPLVISVLKGGFYFLADLTRYITTPINIDFLAVGIYPGVTSQTGIVRITKYPDITITGRHIIMVEDLVGTGLTLGYLYQHMESLKPASVSICALIDSPAIRLVNIPIKYLGFTMRDIPLIGYGIDYNEEYRHIPYIAELNIDFLK